MGNENTNFKKEAYEMNVRLIGNNLTNYKNIISKGQLKNSIQNFWKFEYNFYYDVNTQINRYFEHLQNLKDGDDKTITFKECLLIRITNIFDPEVSLVLKKVDDLEETQYMPLVLFLLEKNYYNGIESQINTTNYENIDKRLIFVRKFDEYDTEDVQKLLKRFCSIHNELGDRFEIGNGEEAEPYDLIDNYFPFNINIACIGRFGQGKSTGVNAILKEYKAKESTKGSSQTKELTYYQVSEYPIRLLDIPGFEDTETVKKAVAKFQQCGEKINKIKDNLHIVLYFLTFYETRTFAGLELPMLEEFCKHRSSKIIYVITHSKPNMIKNIKLSKIAKINQGLQNITKNSSIFNETKNGGMLEATENNVVFVNFHKDNNNGYEEFGTRDLFKKIYDLFILSEDYIKSNKLMTQDYINEQAEKLRAQAKDLLFSNKVWGAVVGIIPGVDWLLQKFVIKKNAVKKLGQLYGIDVKFLNETEDKNAHKNVPNYITPSVDKEQLKNMELKGDELINETTSYKVGNSVKVGGEAASYVGGGVTVGKVASSVASQAAQAAQVAQATEATTGVATRIGSTALKAIGTGLFVVGAALGVGLGGYFTHQYCEDLINQFETYYKNNAEKIGNSYIYATQYLLKEYNN